MKTIIGRLHSMPTPVVFADRNHPIRRWSCDAGNAPVVGAPYSAIGTTESAMTYLDGNRVVQGRTTRQFFRDSQGRTRTESMFISARHPDHESPLDITINDPVADRQYLLQTEKKTFTIVPWKGATAIRPPVLRTDFTDQAAWEAIRNEIQQPTPEGFNKAGVDFIDDRAYEGMSKEQLLAAVPKDYSHSFIIVVDTFAVTTRDHPVLVINLWQRSGAELRAVASEVYLIENNLSLGNLGFEDFVRGADRTGGVYRGL